MKTLLFKPFEKYQEKNLVLAGIIITLTGSALAYFFNGRFDGVLDLHFPGAVQVYQPFMDNLLNIVSMSVCLFGAAFIINKKTRPVDILATVIISRSPLYLLTIFNANDMQANIGLRILNNIGGPDPFKDIGGSDIAMLTAFGFLSILFTIWHIVLLFNGYRVSSNAKGPAAIVLFIAAIVLAEIVSKILISLIP